MLYIKHQVTTVMVCTQMMQVVQEGGRILYLKAKNTVELMEWYVELLQGLRMLVLM